LGFLAHSRPEARVAIAEGQAAQCDQAGITKQRVLEEYRRIAFSDSRSFWETVVVGAAFGVPVIITRLKAITDLTPEQGACLAGFEAVIKNAAGGDFRTDLVHKVKYWPKLDALDRVHGELPNC
jgi:hypothetical protein